MNDVTYTVAIILVRGGGSTIALVRQNIVEVVCVHAEATKLLIYPREAQKYLMVIRLHPKHTQRNLVPL